MQDIGPSMNVKLYAGFGVRAYCNGGDEHSQVGVHSHWRSLLLCYSTIKPSFWVEFVRILAPEVLVSARNEYIERKSPAPCRASYRLYAAIDITIRTSFGTGNW